MESFKDNNGVTIIPAQPRADPIELLSIKGNHTYGNCPNCHKIFSFSQAICPECHISLKPANFSDDGKIDPVEVDKYAKLLQQRNIYLAVGKEETLHVYKNGVFIAKDAELVLKKDLNQLVNLNRHWQAEIINKVKMDTLTSESELNQDKYILTFNNCNYNVLTKETTPLTPTLKSTIKLPVTLNQEGTPTKFLKFLEEIQPNERTRMQIQEMFGYCLLRDTRFDAAFMLIGKGGNGKGQLLEILALMLGRDENTCAISLQSLSNEENKFVLGKLYNKLANIYDDLDSKALNSVGIFKIISSNGQITADRKFLDHITFVNHAKLIFSTNEPPKMQDNSDALWRRWIPIKFNIQIPLEKQIQKLAETIFKEESGEIALWSIQGLNRLLEQGNFTDRPTPEQVKHDYQRMTDSVACFVEECLELDANAPSISKEELHAIYVKFCNTMAIGAIPIKLFGKRLKAECDWIQAGRVGKGGTWFSVGFTEKGRSFKENKVQNVDNVQKSLLVANPLQKEVATREEKSALSTQSTQNNPQIDPKLEQKINQWLNQFIKDYGFTGFTRSNAVTNSSMVFGLESQKIVDARLTKIIQEGGLIEKDIEGKTVLRTC